MPETNDEAPRIPVTPREQPFPALLQQPGALQRLDDAIAQVPFSVFSTAANFDLAQRMARALASSDLVPAQYRDKLANCLIALDIAVQRRQSPLTIMQNMVVIQGRPAWSAQYIIASINACGLFTPLRYEWRGAEGNDAWGCRAFAYDAQNNDRLDGSWITIALAKAEGWYQRTGSKWQTMPEQMLRYRAGAFFGRIYAGHVTLGLPSIEEVADSPLDYQPRLVMPAGNGAAPLHETTLDEISRAAERQAAVPAPAPPAPARRRGRPRTEAAAEAAETPAAPAAAAPAPATPAPAAAPASEPPTPPPTPPVQYSGLEPAPHRSTIDLDPF